MDSLNRKELEASMAEADFVMDEIIRIALKIKLLRGLDNFGTLCEVLSSPDAAINGINPRLLDSAGLWLGHVQRLQTVRDAFDWPAVLDGKGNP